MGYVLGILGALTFIAGAFALFTAATSEQQLRGLMFWLMTAVFFSGEAIVGAINRLREAQRRSSGP